MITINVKLALVILFVVPILIFLITYSNVKMSSAWRTMYGDIAGVNARIEDAVSGVRVVQSYTNEEFEKKRFQENNDKFRKTKTKAYKVMAFVSSNIYVLMRFMTLIVLMVGAWLSYNGELLYGEFVAFILFVNVLFKPIEKISALLEMYPKGMAGFKRFIDLLDVSLTIQDRENAKSVTHLQGEIAFEQATIGNDKTQEPVLRSLN